MNWFEGFMPLTDKSNGNSAQYWPDEEDGRVVADQVPVALLGVELDCEAPGVARRVRRAALAAHRAEPHRQGGLLPDLAEDVRLAVRRDVVGHLGEDDLWKISWFQEIMDTEEYFLPVRVLI